MTTDGFFLHSVKGNIQPICLPVFGQTFSPAQQCYTTGFGVTRQGAGMYV